MNVIIKQSKTKENMFKREKNQEEKPSKQPIKRSITIASSEPKIQFQFQHHRQLDLQYEIRFTL